MGELLIRQPARRVIARPTPAAEMHFVVRHRRVERVVFFALFHPLRVLPFVLRQVDDLRGGFRGTLCPEAVGIALLAREVAVFHTVFVERAVFESRAEEFPEAAGNVLPHRVTTVVPIVELADDADARRVRSPDGEVDAADAVHFAQLRAELVVALPMSSFAEQVQVVLGKRRRECVGVVHHGAFASFVSRQQSIGGRRSRLVQRADCFVQPGRMDASHRSVWAPLGIVDDPSLGRIRQEGPHRESAATFGFDDMGTEQLVRILKLSANQARDRFERRLRAHGVSF